jgi:hypothetical protein
MLQASSDKGAWAHQSRYVFSYKDEKNLKHQLGIEALQNNKSVAMLIMQSIDR